MIGTIQENYLTYQSIIQDRLQTAYLHVWAFPPRANHGSRNRVEVRVSTEQAFDCCFAQVSIQVSNDARATYHI